MHISHSPITLVYGSNNQVNERYRFCHYLKAPSTAVRLRYWTNLYLSSYFFFTTYTGNVSSRYYKVQPTQIKKCSSESKYSMTDSLPKPVILVTVQSERWMSKRRLACHIMFQIFTVSSCRYNIDKDLICRPYITLPHQNWTGQDVPFLCFHNTILSHHQDRCRGPPQEG